MNSWTRWRASGNVPPFPEASQSPGSRTSWKPAAAQPRRNPCPCRTGLAEAPEAPWRATLVTCGSLKVPQVLPGYDLGLPQFGAPEPPLRPPPADSSLQPLTRPLASGVGGHAQRPCRWGHHWPILVPAPRPPGHWPSPAPSGPCDKAAGTQVLALPAGARRRSPRPSSPLRPADGCGRPAHWFRCHGPLKEDPARTPVPAASTERRCHGMGGRILAAQERLALPLLAYR